MANYFNTLSHAQKLEQMGQCEFMDGTEFTDGIDALRGKKIVIIGCGAQGLNQGLNMRDSGLDISYALRAAAIESKRQSFLNASENGFTVGTHEELVPTADLVINLTPDKQHTQVVSAIMPLMKESSCLAYSHGFNIVEEGMQVRKDLTVIMVAPKCPGSEVREEYKRGFGVPTLLAVHPENDPENKGWAQAKAYAVATGGHKAGVLASSEQLPSLQALHLDSTGIGDEGIMAIAESPNLTDLKKLYLCSNKMGDAGAIALAKSKNLKKLNVLSIWRNEIRDKGGQAIAESQNFMNLERLYMSLNLIERPVRKIIRGSELAKRLTTLVMD
jgi:hypothetical protein